MTVIKHWGCLEGFFWSIIWSIIPIVHTTSLHCIHGDGVFPSWITGLDLHLDLTILMGTADFNNKSIASLWPPNPASTFESKQNSIYRKSKTQAQRRYCKKIKSQLEVGPVMSRKSDHCSITGYTAPELKRDIVFFKDFTGFRPSNSHSFTVRLTVLAVISWSHGLTSKYHGEAEMTEKWSNSVQNQARDTFYTCLRAIIFM